MAVGTSVRTEWVTYENQESTITAYLALPEGRGPWPGIVMIHENPGLTEHRQEVTRSLAAEGYAVLTPNLYSRVGGKAPTGATDFERKRGIALAVPDEQVHTDLLAGHGYLLGKAEVAPDCIGLIGFCMGGSKGLYSACQSAVWRCFVDFYGPVEQSADRYGEGRSLIPLVRHLNCPIQFHVGDRDESCTPSQAEALRQELKRHGKDAECYVYEGAQHAFHGDGARHHPAAAAQAWERALDYLRRRLAS